ncbi:MAG: methyl-accepting chemotaxis protein [Candidatus Gastranaerophilales bacterium]|nr:methyl-accepting chemotaxis protein [Candidatus Gastranaerophilales bacterium]
MKQINSLKFKIVASMLFLLFATVVIIGYISINQSSNIISGITKKMLIVNANNSSEEIYNDLKQVEKNVNLMGSFVKKISSIETESDLYKLKNTTYAESEYSKIRIFPKELGENTKWCMSSYFYYDQKYIPAFDGAWYVEKDGKFERSILDTAIEQESGDWYFKPVELRKGLWATPYVDSDLKKAMITYSIPIYKNGFLLGVAGMDITLDELNKLVKNIQIYNNTNAFIIDNNYNFIAGRDFKVGENILTANKGAYKFLADSLANKKSGYVEYKDSKTDKVISFTRLPNGFILLISVPVSEILSDINKMSYLIILAMIVIIVIASFIAALIGGNISDQFTKPIVKIIDNLRQNTQNISSISKQLMESSHQIAAGSSEQAASLEETSATLEESSSMIRQNTENTNQAALLAKQTKDSAEKGNNEMQEMVISMAELKSSSDQIAKIIKIIDDIAFQTNILALNAAVEAARAGEAGLGFAVVAEEVRNLAQRSAQAAKDTASIIESNMNLSEKGVELTKKVNNSLSEIDLQALKVNQLLDEITNASREQAQGITQINKAVIHMEKAVQSNASISQESAENSEKLAFQAMDLKVIVTDLVKLIGGSKEIIENKKGSYLGIEYDDPLN